MNKSVYDKIDICGDWYSGEPLTVTLTEKMLPAVKLMNKIERKIKALRPIYYDFVVVKLNNLKTRSSSADSERINFIQTAIERDYGSKFRYVVEVGTSTSKDNMIYYQYCGNVGSVLELFRRFCIDREHPNDSEWEKHTLRKPDSSEHKYKSIIEKCWDGKLAGVDIHSVKYEALEHYEKDCCEPDFIGSLAKVYVGHDQYDKLKEMFERRSYHPMVAEIMGEIELHGMLGAPNYAKAFDYFMHAKKIGSLTAEYYLAKMYQYGLHVKKDYAEYERILRSVYNKYDENSIVLCPLRIMCDLIAVEQRAGNKDAAVALALKARAVYEHYVSCGGGITDEDVSNLKRLTSLIEFAPSDADLLDLVHILTKPCKVLIVCNGEQIYVTAIDHQGGTIIKCGDKYYRDAASFLSRCLLNGIPLQYQISDIDYMEIL